MLNCMQGLVSLLHHADSRPASISSLFSRLFIRRVQRDHVYEQNNTITYHWYKQYRECDPALRPCGKYELAKSLHVWSSPRSFLLASPRSLGLHVEKDLDPYHTLFAQCARTTDADHPGLQPRGNKAALRLADPKTLLSWNGTAYHLECQVCADLASEMLPRQQLQEPVYYRRRSTQLSPCVVYRASGSRSRGTSAYKSTRNHQRIPYVLLTIFGVSKSCLERLQLLPLRAHLCSSLPFLASPSWSKNKGASKRDVRSTLPAEH